MFVHCVDQVAILLLARDTRGVAALTVVVAIACQHFRPLRGVLDYNDVYFWSWQLFHQRTLDIDFGDVVVAHQ